MNQSIDGDKGSTRFSYTASLRLTSQFISSARHVILTPYGILNFTIRLFYSLELICCIMQLSHQHMALFFIITLHSSMAKVEFKQIVAAEDADFVIGGLFPVHANGKGKDVCGPINSERGIQRLEAMRFAVKEINSNETILKGIKLGVKILDTCSDPTHALDQSLEFVMSTLVASQEDRCVNVSKPRHEEIIAVAGAAYSKVSIQIANLMRLFKIPQISYASTSEELSNKEMFGYFMRTVPPDKLQAKALVDIINKLKWTYVSTVASYGDYGVSGIDSFRRQYLLTTGQCLAEELKLDRNPTSEDFLKIVQQLYKVKSGAGTQAKVVVLFVGQDDAAGILTAATKLGYVNDFIWVASDGWGSGKKPVKGNEKTAQGALTITLKSQAIERFDTYFKNLRPDNNTDNVWFNDYWEKIHNCTIVGGGAVRPPLYTPKNGNLANCTGKETDSKYVQESKIQFVYDAVYSVALGLDKLYKETCGENSTQICTDFKFNNTMRTLLMNYIKSNTETGMFIHCITTLC